MNLDVLSQLQLHVHQLPAAMRGYIEYLISQDARLKACIEQRVIQLRADFTRKGQHARAPDAAARLALGAEVFSHFAIHVGVFDKTGAQRLRERVHAALVKASAAHGDTEQQRRPVVRFLSVLGSLLAQHKVVLGDDPKALPENVTTAGEVFGGWRDGARVLLLPEAVFGAVTSALRASNEQFPISSDTLWTEFKDLGYLAAHEQGRVRIKRHVGAGRTRVLEVWATVLDGPDGTTPGDPTEPPDSGSAAPAAPPPPRRGQTLGADLTSTHASASPGAAPIAPPADEKVVCMLPPPALAAVASAAVRGDSFFASDRGALGAVGEFAGGTNELGPPRSVDPSGVVPGPRRQGPAFAVVTDARELAAVAAAVALAESVALDTETTGLDPLKDRVRLVQLGLPDGSIYVIDTWATVGLGAVAEVLGQVRWLGHNLSFDVGFMRQLAVAPTKVVDTMLLAQVLDCGLNTGVKGYFKLSALLQRHLGIQIPKDEQTSDWSAALQPEQLDYAARDVQHVHALVEALARQLEKLALAPTAALECDLLPALVDLRLSGVYFDRDRWAALNEQRRRDAAEAKAFVERELGIANAASATKQLLPALQRRLGAGVTATNAEALAPYASDPVVQALERFRVATAFVKNHGDPLLATMGKHGDGRVRSDWIQIAAPTGRMACRNPPLLNLPKAQEVRSCVVGPPGHVLVVADFAQIELLVAAQYLKVARLLEVYGNGGDVHRMMAALVAGIPESEVTKEQRRGAKPVNFGFLFGMGPATFVKKAREYEVSYTIDEARRFQGAYLRAYPEVARWHRQIGNSMPAEMRTMGGRVRAFPDRRTGYTERLNMPIQGTAADGFKAAIAILYPRLAALGARIVLAVHDELVVEAPEARAEEVKVCVEAGMIEGMSRFVSEVPIVVEAHIVSSWAEAK
ncbi:MAG: hypothetical protein IT377_20825 [Polyangiaceae bacterium]|nr:hypothetical protein [Polyangiaceae bacterium]